MSHYGTTFDGPANMGIENSQPNLPCNRDWWTSPWRRLAFAGIISSALLACLLLVLPSVSWHNSSDAGELTMSWLTAQREIAISTLTLVNG